ncbi:MAG: riboflavin synthase [Verrucomicrobiota bacterium]
MFTGIVEETGSVFALRQTTHGVNLTLEAELVSQDIRVGDSVAVNGCCLTVTARDNKLLSFDLLAETLRCTNLGQLHEESLVNLERPLLANGRLGGHFVQGHVDCTSPVISFERVEADYRLEVELPPQFARYMIHKGSITIDGISLTAAQVLEKSFVVWIIPHTLEVTNLGRRKSGEWVNLEFDLLAKYLERLTQ